MAAVAAALFATFMVVSPTPTRSAEIPKDVLVVGQVAEPRSLDPHTVTSLNDFRILVNLYDGLVRFREGTLDVEPALAESWSINEAGTVYTFHLRRGVTFHDGSPFDARAVKFNFDRMLKEDHPFHDTGPFPLAFYFSSIRETRVVDAHTVQLVLDKPFAPLLSNLAYPTGLMVSPAAVRRYGKDYGRHPSGTGPFRFVRWETGIRVVAERNPSYWDGPPPLKAIVFRPILDANTRVTELMAGGIDVMLGVPPDLLPVLAARDGFRAYERAGPHLWFLIFNMREGPFSDVRVRQAVNYAINKRALVDRVLQGTATIADGPIAKAFAWAHDDTVEPYPYDPERARKLIREAGYDGAKLVLYAPEGGSGMLEPVAMATAIQSDLAQVGLHVEIRTFEWNTFLARVNHGLAGQADMAEMAWMTNDPDTLLYLALRRAAWPGEGGFNSGYYANPEVDRLIEEARTSTDRAERARFYHRIQHIVHDDAPWAFVASWKQNAVTRSDVIGFRLEPSFLLRLHDTRKR